MAQTMAYLQSRVQSLLGDTQMSTYSQQMYQDAINFAIERYCDKTGVSYVETAVTPDASGMCLIPVNYLRISRIYFLVGGTTQTELTESTLQWESSKSATWQSTTGIPKRWLQFSGLKVKLTPVPNPIYAATIGLLESPLDITGLATAGAFVATKWYVIRSIGTTDFTLIGAASNTVGLQFLATGVGSGTGTAEDLIDLRVPDADNEHLKYAASSWLLMLDGDNQNFGESDKLMSIFNQLVGYDDPVLEKKMKETRTEPKREM
jgi:hypothetical protein